MIIEAFDLYKIQVELWTIDHQDNDVFLNDQVVNFIHQISVETNAGSGVEVILQPC